MNRRALLLGAAMVLLVNFVTVALRAYAEGAFLRSYDKAQLPWLFVASAAGFAAATFAYDVITKRIAPRIVDQLLVVVLIAAAAAAPSLLAAGASPVVLVVGLVAIAQLVGLALWNRVAEAVAGRDARRNLPRVGAAVTAGGMVAGLGAGLLKIQGETLAYLCAGAAAIVLGLAIAQARALGTGGAPGAALPAGASDVLGSPQLRLLRALVLVAVLEGIVATVVDFQFLAEVKAEYTGDTLTTVLLLFYGGTNALLLLLQATAAPRLLVTKSLPFTGAIHPTAVVLWLFGVVAAPGLVSIAGTRTTDQVLRLATSRTAQEVSLSAFPPLPRARWKVLLRGALFSVGAALAALALVVIGRSALEHPARLAALAIGVAVVFWIAARISARRFQAALAAPLNIQTRRKADDPTRIDLATLESWTHVAGDDDPKTAALGRAALARAKVDATDLADQLRHDEPAVRAALFHQLARSPAPSLVRELRAAVVIEDDDRALALGLEALAIAGDDGALERGRSRAALSNEVADAVRASELTLRGSADLAELGALIERDPSWAVAAIRAQRVRDGIDAAASAKLAAASSKLAAASGKLDAAASSNLAASSKLDAAASSKLEVAASSKLDVAASSKLDTAASSKLAAGSTQLDAASSSKLAAASSKPAASSKLDAAASSKLDAASSSKLGAAATRLDDATLTTLLQEAFGRPARRRGALFAIAHVGTADALPLLDAELAAGASDAITAIATLDERAAVGLAGKLGAFSPLARLAIARALAATPSATAAIGILLEDHDPEVAHAALRTALAVARGGGDLPAAPIAAAHRAALAALIATLDARDAAHAASLAIVDPPTESSVPADQQPKPPGMPWSPVARHELELATRNAVARLMWASAVEVAAAGRDPAALAATARRLIGGREPDRKRALDVTQELQAGRTDMLAVIERWLKPAAPRGGSPEPLAEHDPWLAQLCRGELVALEPTLATLRKPALFATITGPALAALAEHAHTRRVDGELFAGGAAGTSMFVVASGALLAHREPLPPRKIEVGGVVGELAVLTGAPRAATVRTDGPAEVIEIDRDVFATAARRAPELVLGLSATLAGWLAPNRPDVLG